MARSALPLSSLLLITIAGESAVVVVSSVSWVQANRVAAVVYRFIVLVPVCLSKEAGSTRRLIDHPSFSNGPQNIVFLKFCVLRSLFKAKPRFAVPNDETHTYFRESK